MKCSNCGHDMIAAKTGFLCLNCGHTDASEPTTRQITHESPAKVEPVVAPAPEAAGFKPFVHTPVESAPPSGFMAHPADTEPAVHPVVPVVPPHTDPNPVVAPAVMPNSPAHEASKRKLAKLPVILGVVVLLLVAGGAAAYKMAIYDAQHAPEAYLQKLLDAKTGQFNGAASYSSPQDSSSQSFVTGQVGVTASGVYDVTDTKNPKSDVKLAVKYSGTSISGEIMIVPKLLYFKIDELGFLSSFGLTISKDWYKTPIDSQSQNKCSDTKHQKSGTFFGVSTPKSLPLKDTKRVGLFETIDGHQTSHFSGTVDMDKLPSYIDDVNKELSADCKISIDKEAVKDYDVSYNIWRGGDFDRAEFKVTEKKTKAVFTSTFDSKNYNQAVTIKEPTGAKTFNSLASFDAQSSPATFH